MRARLKTEIWDVWQYNGVNQARPLWVLNCTDKRAGAHLSVVDINGQWRTLDLGDWLVRDTAGMIPEVMNNDAFRRDYEIVA